MSILDKQRIRQDFSKAAKTYDAAAVVQHEICDRALERLQMLKLQPKRILDIGAGTGRSVRGLQAMFPNSQIIASDLALAMLLQQGKQNVSICCDTEYLPVQAGSIDLIFSTSTFQWCENLNLVFKECMRVLNTKGVLVFSTFGPDTLHELRTSWMQVDEYHHVHDFIDMHHIGDMLLANQFLDPVVDRENIVVEYQQLQQLLKDLKATGSREKFTRQCSNHSSSLAGKSKLQQLEATYESFRQDNGLLPACYEVIYGYASKPSKSIAQATSGAIKVSMSKIK